MADETNGRLAGAGRADPPSSWRHTTELGPDVEMTWHHVIPLRCLSSVWNGLVDGGHWEAAERYLHVAGASDAGRLVDLMRTGGVQGEDRDRIHMLVTWQGWNIVEGPGGKCRVDDPGDAFEAFHWTTLSSNQRSTMQAAEALHGQMGPLSRQLGNADPQPISSEQAERLSAALAGRQSVLRNKSPIPFSDRMWTKVDAGRPGKRKPAYQKKQIGASA